MSKEKTISRILKLLKLSNGTDKENESQNAVLMAQKMMIEDELATQEEIDTIGVEAIAEKWTDNEKKDKSMSMKIGHIVKPVTNYVKNISVYEGWLAMVIADNFRCYCYKDNNKLGQRLMFVGLKDDAKLAFEVYHFAYKTMIYHMKEFIKEEYASYGKNATQGVRNDYMNGYIKGLEDKFNKQVLEQNFAPALIKHEIVEDAWAKLKEELGIKAGRKRSVSSAGDKDARSEGYKQGKQFEYGLTSIK
jgi:hypothetical protein